jgi:hypothetical protein
VLSHMNYNCITSASDQSVRPRVKKEWGCQDMGNWSSLMIYNHGLIHSKQDTYRSAVGISLLKFLATSNTDSLRSWLQLLMRNLTGQFVHLL